MNVPATTKASKLMLLDFMADKYGLHPQEFADTVRKTCGLPTATAEEFAAFIMVARQYDLNPILREIHAFPRKGGGIVPVVSVDGWLSLINRQPTCDGFEFDTHHSDDGELIAMTCRMYRKDRAHPVEVTEYLSECIRQTDAWKMRHRMLRHRTLMQAGRYAFGFSGIYDEDEGARIAEAPMRDITPPDRTGPSGGEALNPPKPAQARVSPAQAPRKEPPVPPKRPVPPVPPEHQPEPNEIVETVDGENREQEQNFGEELTPGELLSELDDALGSAKTIEEIQTIWDDYDLIARLEEHEEEQGWALGIKRRHVKRVST